MKFSAEQLSICIFLKLLLSSQDQRGSKSCQWTPTISVRPWSMNFPLLAHADDVTCEKDVLQWQNHHSEDLPTWSKVCKNILLLHPSSVASNRIFSLSENSILYYIYCIIPQAIFLDNFSMLVCQLGFFNPSDLAEYTCDWNIINRKINWAQESNQFLSGANKHNQWHPK